MSDHSERCDITGEKPPEDSRDSESPAQLQTAFHETVEQFLGILGLSEPARMLLFQLFGILEKTKELEEFFKGLLSLSSEERESRLRQEFAERLGDGSNIQEFYNYLATLNAVDSVDISLAHSGETAEAFLSPLALDDDIFTAAVQVLREKNAEEAFVQFVEGQRRDLRRLKQRDGDERRVFDMRGGGDSAAPKSVEEYSNRVMDAMRQEDGERLFQPLCAAYQIAGQELFGKDKQILPTNGTFDGFRKLCFYLQQKYPDRQVIFATDCEFFPMRCDVHQNVHSLEFPNYQFSEEIIATNLFAKIKELLSGKSEAEIRRIPILIVLSSTFRPGGKSLNTELFFEEFQKIQTASEANSSEVLLWFLDESLGEFINEKTDGTALSKRTGSYGKGTLVLSGNQKMQEFFPDLPGVFSSQAGISTKIFTEGIVHFSRMKRGNPFGTRDLLEHPEICRKVEGEKTLAGEIAAGEEFLRSSRLNELFTLEHSPPKASRQSGTLLRLVPEENAQNLNLVHIQHELQGQGFYVDTFALRQHSEFAEIQSLFDADPFDLENFRDAAEKFQNAENRKGSILRPLVPAQRKDDAEYVRTYFQESVRLHNSFRMSLSTSHPKGTLVELLRVLEGAVSGAFSLCESHISPSVMPTAETKHQKKSMKY
ncbi:hypothetical protein HZA38_05755 [Candidatus Peregrinibacteria bacterium]|nr:hypothetical protein [Candidatus Peregrinibacteria bacterium]